MAENRFTQSPVDQVVNELQARTDELGKRAAQIGERTQNSIAEQLTAPPVSSPRAKEPSAESPPAASFLKDGLGSGKSAKNGILPPPDLAPLFASASAKYGVPINALAALADQESTYNPKATGTLVEYAPGKWTRAKGLMQYIDPTAQAMGIDPYDPAQSIDAAAKQLRERLDKGMSLEEAMAEHFGGPDRNKWGPKTAQYMADVSKRMADIGQRMYDQQQVMQDAEAEQAGIAQQAQQAKAGHDQRRADLISGKGALAEAQAAFGAPNAPSPLTPEGQQRYRDQQSDLPSPLSNQTREGIKGLNAREHDNITGANEQKISAYEPTLMDRIKGLGGPNKDRATVELAMREAAAEKGISVAEAYRRAGGDRSMLNPEGRSTGQAMIEGVAVAAPQIRDVLPSAVNTVLRTIRAGDVGPEKTWLDKSIDATDTSKPDGWQDPNYEQLQGLGQSLGYSFTTMAASAVAAAAAGFTGPVGSGAAAMATGGTVAYRASKDQFLDQVRDHLDEKSMQTYQRKLTDKEWSEAAKEFESAAKEYGAWEAIPEAVGNLIFVKAIAAPLKGMRSMEKVAEVAKRLGHTQASEQTTELATSIGQQNPQLEAGLTNEQQSAGDLLRGQAVNVGVTTGIMGLVGAGGHAGADAIRSRMGRAKAEQAATAEQAAEQAQAAQQATAAPQPQAAPQAPTPAPTPAPTEAAPEQQATVQGPLARAAAKAKQSETAERVTVQTPTGPVTGTLESFTQQGSGWTARVLSDDNQLYKYTDKDGVQIDREADQQAQQPAEDMQQTPAEAQQSAPDMQQTEPQAQQPAENMQQPAEDMQQAAPESEPYQALMPDEEEPAQAPAPKPQASPLDDETPSFEASDYSRLDEAQLRAAMKLIGNQIKNKGTNPALRQELGRITRELNKRLGHTPAAEVVSKPEKVVSKPAKAVSTPEKVVSKPAQVVSTPAAKLPKELDGAKPRYNFGDKAFDLSFESDVDRAAYIAAQKNPSARDADYVKFVSDATGMAENEVRAHGEAVRSVIKAMARNSEPGTLTIPATHKPASNHVEKTEAPVAPRDENDGRAVGDDPMLDQVKQYLADGGALDGKAISSHFKIGFNRAARMIEQLNRAESTAPATKPAPDESVKWFGTREKAEGFIGKKKLGETHEIRQTAKARFEIHPKAEQATEAKANPLHGEDIDGDWMHFAKDSGTKGIPRAEMPQIKAEHRGAMVNFLNARGIEHQEETVPASSLKPTQAEFSREKVAKAKSFTGGDRSILVSSDNHVLDGHHQWLAKHDSGEDVKVIRLDAPIDQLLDTIKEFPSATTDEGATPSAAKEQADELEQYVGKTLTMGKGRVEVKVISINGDTINVVAGGRMNTMDRATFKKRLSEGGAATREAVDLDSHPQAERINAIKAKPLAAGKAGEDLWKGAKRGDRITLSGDVLPAKAGTKYLIEDIEANGAVHLATEDGPIRVSQRSLIEARDRGVSFSVESAPVEHKPQATDPEKRLMAMRDILALESRSGVKLNREGLLYNKPTDRLLMKEGAEFGTWTVPASKDHVAATVTFQDGGTYTATFADGRPEATGTFPTEIFADPKGPFNKDEYYVNGMQDVFDKVRELAKTADAPATPEAPKAKAKAKKQKDTPQSLKAAEYLGAGVGEQVIPSGDIGYATGGQTYTIDSIGKDGSVYLSTDAGSRTGLSRAEMIAAKSRGVTFSKPAKAEAEAVTPTEQPAKAEATPETASSVTLTDLLYAHMKAGTLPTDNVGLRKLVEAFDGKPVDNARLKLAQEDLEAAMVLHARDLVKRNMSDKLTFKLLRSAYEQQPNLNIRTSTSVANQAYSTPAPLAYMASELAQIGKGVRVYEPTAGNGMLLIGADPKLATANEMNDHRYENLKALGFDAIQGDAMEAISSGAVRPKSQDAVITNPPFGSIKDENGKATKVAVDGFKLGQIDHLIAAEALKAMKDDGRAVLILGANKVAGGLSTDDRIFFNWLYSHYNVTGHFELDGKLYSRQGAGWPVRVITINGRMESDRVSPTPGTVQRTDTWDGVYEQYQQLLGAQERAGEQASSVSRGDTSGHADDARATPATDGRQAAKPVQERADTRSEGPDANVGGTRAGAVSDQPGQKPERVAPSRDAERPNAGATGANRLGEGKDRDAAAKPAGRGDAAKPDAGRTPRKPVETDNNFQASYVPRSGRKDENVLVPVNMAQPLQDALARLEDEVGDIDQFAAKELGYSNTDELHDALMGLQVDSVASAIHQMKRNKGTIIADQTGIGKGRQAASIIRWAARNGHVPVFMSVKPSLFSDMHGDLADIGTHDITPFIVNEGEAVVNAAKERLFAQRGNARKQNIQHVALNGELPEGHNAMFLTYSQINKANEQRKALAAIAHKAVFVLDEAHNASGDSQTGAFMKEVLDGARGVVYLSATYAKRPDNMPLYFKTDIGKAIGDSATLTNAMAMGGLPLQTVVSNNLVKAGQMFRRERSYSGISIQTVVDTANRAKHVAMSDETTKALRAIVDADSLFHNGYVQRLKKELAERGEAIEDVAGNQAEESVDHTGFTSVVHNFVRQMLLGLKADTAAEHAIAAIKAGQKPVIALENTMGSFLAEYAENNSLSAGDSLGSFDYRNVLSRALERTLVVRRVLPNGDKVKEAVPLNKLDTATREKYRQAQEVIDSLDLGNIPVSPLDWIRHRIEEAGYSVAEITGRNLSVKYSKDGEPKLSRLSAAEQNDKVGTTRKFNSGELDALILNVAGSTGISLHASEKFKDQRPRHMIVAQPAQDINIFMQMLGRVFRTGQVVDPSFAILNADLPTEKRPTALLNMKMKSLNANTSSNTESATSIKSMDMLNKYGDQVVANYLADDQELARQLDLSGSMDEKGNPTEDIARKATGRIAVMPVERQEAFYNEIEEQYEGLINYLNETNQNELEPRTFDYAAELKKDHTLVEATDPTSPFGSEAVYGEYAIKAQGKAMTPGEIRKEVAGTLDGKHPTEHVGAIIDRLRQQHADALNESRKAAGLDTRDFDPEAYRNWVETKFPNGYVDQMTTRALVAQSRGEAPPAFTASNLPESDGESFMRDHRVGTFWRVELNGDVYNGVVTNIRNTHKQSGSPFALSKIQVTLAVNGPLRTVTLPASQWKRVEVARLHSNMQNMDGLFKEQTEGTETAKIITGNLLAAYGELKDTQGTIINFTKKDGSTEQGILLPRSFKLEENTQQDFHFKSAEDLIKVVKGSENPMLQMHGITSRDLSVRVKPHYASVEILVPKSKARGAKYFLDKALTAVAGDFVSEGPYMVARPTPANATEAVRLLMEKTPLYAPSHLANDARAALGLAPVELPKSDAKRSVSIEPVKEGLTQGALGEMVGNLVDAGRVVLHDKAPDDVPGTAAWTDNKGVIHLVAPNLTPENVQPVLMHEAVHAGAASLMSAPRWQNLTKQLGAVYKAASEGRLNGPWKHAYDRVQSAIAQGDTMDTSRMAEELGAYAVEHFEQMPASVRKWAETAIGAVKDWAQRRLGVQLGGVTPGQLRSLAAAALRAGTTDLPAQGSDIHRSVKAEDQHEQLGTSLPNDPNKAIEAGIAALTDGGAQYRPDFKGDILRDIGRIAKFILHPRQIAALHKPFTPVYETGLSQAEMRDSIIDDLQRYQKRYATLDLEGKANVNKILELGRLMGETYTRQELESGIVNTGERTHVEVDENGRSRRVKKPLQSLLTTAGEFVKLTPEEAKAYIGLRRMFDNALDRFKAQTLIESGFQDVAHDRQAAKKLLATITEDMPQAKAERVANIARFVDEIEQAKRTGYVPFARYGEYAVSVKEQKYPLELGRSKETRGWITRGEVPEQLKPFIESLGAKWDADEDGYPLTNEQRRALLNENERTLHSTTVELSPLERAKIAALHKMGKDIKPEDLKSVREAMTKAEALKGNNPKRRITAFSTLEKKPEGGVRLQDVDALAQVAMLDNQAWDAVRDQLADAIKGRSFRKHFFQSDNVPGYTGDFERAIADYMGGMAGYLSRRKHAPLWDKAVDSIKQARLYDYAVKYRDYVNNPQEELGMLRGLGFFMYIAGNTATAVANLTQPFVMTLPALSMATSTVSAVKHMALAYKDALAMTRVNKRVGLDMFDPRVAPADVRAELRAAWAEGAFVARQTHEVMMTANQSNLGRSVSRKWNKTLQATAFMFAYAERLNRLVTFIAAARLAKDPSFVANMRKTFGTNSLAQSMLTNPTAKNIAEFLVDETQFRMGKTNRPTAGRGIGAPVLQFKNFMMQSIETWLRWAFQNGIQGVKATAMSMAVIGTMAGPWGLPGAQELRGAVESAYKLVTKTDLNMEAELRQYVAETTKQQWLGEIASRGVPYAMGLDMSRVGMGNIFPSDAMGWLGIQADMLIGRGGRAGAQALSGNGIGAASELMPNFAKNFAQAYDWSQNGVRDKQGRVIIPAEDVTANTLVQRSLGWKSTQVTNRQDYEYAAYRAEHAVDGLRSDYVSRLSASIVKMEKAKDVEAHDKAQDELRKTLADLKEYNADAPLERQIKITKTAVMNKVHNELGGKAVKDGRERKQARMAVKELRGLYGIE